MQCAWAATRTKGTYLRSKYDSLVGRRGKKKALIAVGHKILIATYYILKDQVAYKELGSDFLDSKKKNKQVQHHLKRLKELGLDAQQLEQIEQMAKVAWGRFLLEVEISRQTWETPHMKLTVNAKHTRVLLRACTWNFNSLAFATLCLFEIVNMPLG